MNELWTITLVNIKLVTNEIITGYLKILKCDTLTQAMNRCEQFISITDHGIDRTININHIVVINEVTNGNQE
jgi:hypothetical protein